MVVARGRICCGLYKTHVKAYKKKFNAVGTIEKTPQLRVMVNSVAPKRVNSLYLTMLQMEERYVMMMK
jgi:hypothetical protein